MSLRVTGAVLGGRGRQKGGVIISFRMGRKTEGDPTEGEMLQQSLD
jgi:hypothetical protein